MSFALNLGVVFGLIGALLAMMAGLRHLSKTWGWHAEMSRKVIHVCAGSLACALPWLLSHAWQVWLLLGLTGLAMIGLRSRAMAGIGGALHGVKRQSWGDFLLVLSVALIYVLFGGEPVLYVLPLLILTLADAAAALAGVRYGQTFFTTEDGVKSVEGSAMFFLVALIVSMICLLLLTNVPRANVIAISTGVAVFATVLEADSWDGFDNLFLPLGVFILLAITIETTDATVILRLGVSLAAAAIGFVLSRIAGAGPHVARVHALALFLLLAVVYPLDALLPAIAMIGPVAVLGPRHDARRALQIVGVLALMSFAFLAVEPATGHTAIPFFGLFCAATAAAHLGHATARPGLAALCGIGLSGLWWLAMVANPSAPDWHGPILIPGTVVIFLSAVAPALWPRAAFVQSIWGISVLGALPATLILLFELVRVQT
ncbi:MAG: hypothetical protein AAGF88_12060 [Pseudomonadota bacterium]